MSKHKKVIIVIGTGILAIGGVCYFVFREKEGKKELRDWG